MENIIIRDYKKEDREVIAKIFMTEYVKFPYDEKWKLIINTEIEPD